MVVQGFSVPSAVKYGKIGLIRDWLETNPESGELGQFLLTAAGVNSSSTDVVELLIRAGADPNFTKEADGYVSGPPLSVAAHTSSLSIVKRLVELGADVTYSAPHSFNAMNCAAYNTTSSMMAIVEYLISFGIDLDVESKYSESPLSVASRRGCFDVVELLLNAGADPSRLDWTPLMHAAVFGSLAECQAVLRVNPRLAERDRLWQRTAFLLAVQSGDTEKAALLLANGAERDDRGRCDKTSLMHAAEMNHGTMVEWLISRGADVDAVDQFGKTALITAAAHGSADCVRILLELGADINAVTHTRSSAIDQSCNIQSVLVLRDAGADIDRIAGDGYNLLKYAVDQEDLEFVQQLLEIGADPNQTSTGEVPLHIAIRQDDVEITRALLKYGADPNATDVDGWTPLFSARSIEAARLLVDAGADLGLTEMGKTALDHVSEQVRAFLKNRVAR